MPIYIDQLEGQQILSLSRTPVALVTAYSQTRTLGARGPQRQCQLSQSREDRYINVQEARGPWAQSSGGGR